MTPVVCGAVLDTELFLNISTTVDCGDYVIVTNSKKIKVSGRKDEQLLFRKHSMYPGGLKETPYKDMMDRNPGHVCCQKILPIFVMFIIDLDYSPRRVRYVAKEQTSG